MSLKKAANWAGDVWGEFTGAADVERAQQQAGRDIMGTARQGAGRYEDALASSQARLDPFLMGGVRAQERLEQELFGAPTEASALPGYESMVAARGEGLDQLASGRAGMGQLFSGRTAQSASNLSGGMEQQLRNLYMGNLRQQAGQGAGIGQYLGSQEVGTAGNIANLMMGGRQAASGMNVNAAQTGANTMADLLGTVGTVGGFLMGGPMGGAGGNPAGGGGSGFSYNPSSMTREAPQTFSMGF